MNQIRIIKGYPAILTKDATWMSITKPRIVPGAVIILPEDAVLIMPPDADIEVTTATTSDSKATTKPVENASEVEG